MPFNWLMSAIYVARSVFGSQKDYADKGVTTRCDDNPLFGEVVWAPSQDQNMKRSDRTWKNTGHFFLHRDRTVTGTGTLCGDNFSLDLDHNQNNDFTNP